MKVRPAALIIRDQEILLMRYRYGNSDVFMLPGGNQDPGETLTDTIKREIQEELTLDVETSKMVICGEVILWPNKEDTLHCIFEAEITSGTPVLNPEHTSAQEIVWLPISELENKHIYPNVGEAILQLQQGALNYCHVGRIDQPFVK